MGAQRLGATILLYHSVARVAADPFAMTTTPEQFAGHMEVLARHFTPLPLRDVVAGLDQ